MLVLKYESKERKIALINSVRVPGGTRINLDGVYINPDLI